MLTFNAVNQTLADPFHILVQELIRFNIEMKDDRDVLRVEDDYDVMSHGVPTLKKVLDLLNDDRALTAAHLSLMKSKVGLEGKVFETMFADFKPQLIENLTQRIAELETLVQTAIFALNMNFICEPEDFTAFMDSVDLKDEKLLFRHPQFLAIEGHEKEAAGILLDSLQGKPLLQYINIYDGPGIITNIVIARYWFQPLPDGWEDSLRSDTFNYKLSEVLIEKNEAALITLITSRSLHTAALMHLICSEHLALAKTLIRALGEAAMADVPLEALPMLYLCHKKLGDDNGPAFVNGFISQFADRSLKDIVKFCSGFNSVDDRMDYLCQPAILNKLTLKDIQDLVEASNPMVVLGNEKIFKRWWSLLIDEESIYQFEAHMRAHQNSYQKCDAELKMSMKTAFVLVFFKVDNQQSQAQQSGRLMTQVWRQPQSRVPINERMKQFLHRIDTIFDPEVSNSINMNNVRACRPN